MRKTLELTVEKNEEHRRNIAIYVRENLNIEDGDIKARV
jgi:hypothetical protein